MKKSEIGMFFAVPVAIITFLWTTSYLLHICIPEARTWWSFAAFITILFFGVGAALLAGAVTVMIAEKFNK